MEFVKSLYSTTFKDYSYQSSTTIKMDIIWHFFGDDVQCFGTMSFRNWAFDPVAMSTGGNITDFFKEDDKIVISDSYSLERVPTEVYMTNQQFVQLLDDWEEKVCKLQPKEVVITRENDQFNIVTGEGILDNYVVPENAEEPDLLDDDEAEERRRKEYLKFEYENILGMQLIGEKFQVRGFFHDYLGEGEKQGVFVPTNKVVGPGGCYAADLVVMGQNVLPHKTFYPADWSRGKVMTIVSSAYGQCMQSGFKPTLEKSGKYKIKGITSEGVEIEMFIAKDDNTMVVAYPKVGT